MREFLTAAVDGELDAGERRAVKRLLRESGEARELFRALKEDARGLRELPRQKLPAHFASQVLQSVGQSSQTVPATIASAAQKYLPMWANFAAAASIMLALGVGTYLIVALNDQQKAKQAAERKPKPPESSAPSSPSYPEIAPPIVRDAPRPSSTQPDELPLPRDEDIATVPMPELPDAAEPEGKGVLTIPFNKSLDLFRVEMPKLPPILPLRELDQAAHKATVVETLRGDEAFHVDLFCKDANRSFERIQVLLKAQGKRVVVETVAQQRMQARLKTNYVFFTEAMTADDIAKLLAALAVEERNIDAKHSEKVVIASMSANSQKTLATLLGIDPKLLLTKPNTAAHDPLKSVSDSTAEKLEKALAEKARPGAASPSRNDGPVIALSFNPVRPNPQLSKEVRDFLASRRDRKAGAVSLMLVVRNMD